MVGMQPTPRVFEYARGDKFKVTVIMQNGEFHCFGSQAIPENTPRDVALAFYREAERAATKYLEREASAVSNE